MQLQFMQRAIEVARLGMNGGAGGPFGAVVVRDGVVLAEASNRVTSAHDPTAHAEVEAIRAACAQLGHHSLQGCEIYSSCEPCPMCLSAIYWARLDSLYFAASRSDAAEIGFDDAFIYTEIGREQHARQLRSQQVLRDEALCVMHEWRQVPPERRY